MFHMSRIPALTIVFGLNENMSWLGWLGKCKPHDRDNVVVPMDIVKARQRRKTNDSMIYRYNMNSEDLSEVKK